MVMRLIVSSFHPSCTALLRKLSSPNSLSALARLSVRRVSQNSGRKWVVPYGSITAGRRLTRWSFRFLVLFCFDYVSFFFFQLHHLFWMLHVINLLQQYYRFPQGAEICVDIVFSWWGNILCSWGVGAANQSSLNDFLCLMGLTRRLVSPIKIDQCQSKRSTSCDWCVIAAGQTDQRCFLFLLP